MNFDFTRAALKHSTWKIRVRDFLDGKGSLAADEAMNHRKSFPPGLPALDANSRAAARATEIGSRDGR